MLTNNPEEKFKFQTFGDPKLTLMLQAANTFAGSFVHQPEVEPYWLVMLGPSGTGKTHLATQVCSLARQVDELIFHHELMAPVQFHYWPALLAELKEGNYHFRRQLIEANFVVIDELGGEQLTAFAISEAASVLNQRMRRWTVITSNFLRHQIAESMDVRIASRLTRQGNLVCDTHGVKDFELRGNRDLASRLAERNAATKAALARRLGKDRRLRP